MGNCILQWNLNGFYNNFNELKILISDFNPFAICIQESHFDHSRVPTLKNFSIFYKLDQFHMRASGGVAICVKEGFHAKELELDTDLQAVAVQMCYPLEFTLVSLYLPPNQQIQRSQLDDFIVQLPTPFLITTDCNAQNIVWGSRQDNARGKLIESCINDWNLNIFNDGSPTHFSMAHNSFSAIDISFGSACLSSHFNWSVHSDLCSSDHFPIILTPLTRNINATRRPRWVTTAADWRTFQQNVTKGLDDKNPLTPLEQLDHFSSTVLNSAKKTIPRTSSEVKKCKPPWWCSEVSKCIKERNKAFKTLNRRFDSESEKRFKFARAVARRTIRRCQNESWQKYVSSINNSTPLKDVWSKVQKISGKTNFQSITCIESGSGLVYPPNEIAEELGKQYYSASSTASYSLEFTRHMLEIQKTETILFEETVQSDLNIDFSMQELQIALKSCKGSSTGPDNIHYDMLKNIPIDGHFYLLRTFNNIWNQRVFPAQWRDSIIVPIKKPDKNPLKPSSYRPISLTCCECKVFEKMINRRLSWYLESNNLIDIYQSGFRKYRSTLDNLSLLENDIQKAFSNKKHLVCIFFDLEKAYDTCWNFRIIKTLSTYGIRGNMLHFIQNFVRGRTFRVVVGNSYSSTFAQENGVPQGSVLSVTLFLVAMNSLKEFIPTGVKKIKFADDFAAYISGSSLLEIQRTLQTTLQCLENWCDKTGFRFSVNKTKIIHFCRKTSCTSDVTLTLHGKSIEVVDNHKFLGMIFDKKLNWNCHLKQAKAKSMAAVRIIRTLSNTTWGSNRKTLLTLHNTLVLSRLEYGSIIYNSASATRLKQLDPVHHLGVRLAIGAYRTSPTLSILCDAGMMPLSYRRTVQTLVYGTKALALPSHPLNEKLSVPSLSSRSKTFHSLVYRFQNLCTTFEIDATNLHCRGFLPIPPWTIGELKIDSLTTTIPKMNMSPLMFQNEFFCKVSEYPGYYFIYTDGSKYVNSVGCAVFSEQYQKQLRLPDNSTIFSAELIAIISAIEYALENDTYFKYLIISDSISSLQALQNPFSENALIQDILLLLMRIKQKNKVVNFLWVPSHVGIFGNEMADQLAKEATTCQEYLETITHHDLIVFIKHIVKHKWQDHWEALEGNKLRSIKSTTSQWNTSLCSRRQDSVILARLRIGHTRLTHEYVFKREDPPECSNCQSTLTVEHILNSCPQYANARSKYNITSQNLFDDFAKNENLFKFLKDTKLYNEI